MYRLLLIGMQHDNFFRMVKALREDDRVELDHADSGSGALANLLERSADLVVADEKLNDMSGLELAAKLVVQDPMVNCALVSSLGAADFHEASEGLGILAQLPPEPDASQAVSLLEKLGSVTGRNV